MSKYLRIASLAGAILNSLYLLWLTSNAESFLGWTIVVAEFIFVVAFNLFVINNWNQTSANRSYRKPQGALDVFLPVVNEPLEMFERTLKAATNIKYANKKIYVLDDGKRLGIKKLAKEYGAKYIARNTSEHYKAGNMNNGLRFAKGEFILALDADQIVTASIAEHLLGHFQKWAYLAIITTKQRYRVPRADFNNDYIFYLHMQRGKNRDNAAISTGTGVIYRRSAIDAIGGFQTWNIVEDMQTSYALHRSGYKSLYVNKAYTIGTAPLDLPTIYKQRGTWATDSLRMFFKQNPLFVKGLTIRQRLHYFEIGFGYIMPAIAIPIICSILPLSLLLHDTEASSADTYSLMGLPAYFLIMLTVYMLSNRTTNGIRLWMALFPVYFKSISLALRKEKMRYVVTQKTGNDARAVRLIVPQITVVVANLVALAVQFYNQINLTDIMNFAWFMIMVYCFYPVFEKGLQLNIFKLSVRTQRQRHSHKAIRLPRLAYLR